MKILKLAIKDFLTAKMLILSLLPLIFCLLTFGVILYFSGAEIFEILSEISASGDISSLSQNAYPILTKILTFWLTKWLIMALFYTAGTFLVLIFSVFCAAFIAGFLTPIIVKDINQKYYQRSLNNDVSTLKIFKISLVEILKFLAILIICVPFLFVPILNLFIINVPFFYIYYKFMLIDIGSNALNSEKFHFFYKKGGGYKFLFSTFCFYLLCLIPFVAIFAQLFFVIFLSHLVLVNEKNYFLR